MIVEKRQWICKALHKYPDSHWWLINSGVAKWLGLDTETLHTLLRHVFSFHKHST